MNRDVIVDKKDLIKELLVSIIVTALFEGSKAVILRVTKIQWGDLQKPIPYIGRMFLVYTVCMLVVAIIFLVQSKRGNCRVWVLQLCLACMFAAFLTCTLLCVFSCKNGLKHPEKYLFLEKRYWILVFSIVDYLFFAIFFAVRSKLQKKKFGSSSSDAFAPGSLTICATTTLDGNVSGFQFKIRRRFFPVGHFFQTDENGIADIELKPGIYSIYAINVPSDYVQPSNKPRAITIEGGQPAMLRWEFIKKQGIIKINLLNAAPQNGDHPLEGAIFEVWQGDALRDVTATTDTGGYVQTKPLPLGSYAVVERKAPKCFLLCKTSFPPVVLSGEYCDDPIIIASVEIPQQPQMGKITIKRINDNEDLGQYPLSGAVYDISKNYHVVATLLTDENGEAQSEELPLGNYVVREKSASRGFMLNPKDYPVALSYMRFAEVATTRITIPEQPQAGMIRIKKINGNTCMGMYAPYGAIFEVLREDIVVATVKTNEDGIAKTDKLPLGNYLVREKTAPHGFVREKKKHIVCLSYDEREEDVVCADIGIAGQPQVGRIIVRANDISDYSGIVFEIYSVDKTNLLESLYCNQNGTATSKPLRLGTYCIKATTTTSARYTLKDSWDEVVLAYGNQDEDVITKTFELPVSEHTIPFSEKDMADQLLLLKFNVDKKYQSRYAWWKERMVIIGQQQYYPLLPVSLDAFRRNQALQEALFQAIFSQLEESDGTTSILVELPCVDANGHRGKVQKRYNFVQQSRIADSYTFMKEVCEKKGHYREDVYYEIIPTTLSPVIDCDVWEVLWPDRDARTEISNLLVQYSDNETP